MDLGVSLVISAGFSLILVVLGGISLLKVPTKNKQIKATERILNKRVFEDVRKVKEEYGEYFVVIIGHLTRANTYFYFAFVTLSMTVVSINPGMSIFQAMGKVLLFAWIPFVISGVVKYQVMKLRSDCFDKLNEN